VHSGIRLNHSSTTLVVLCIAAAMSCWAPSIVLADPTIADTTLAVKAIAEVETRMSQNGRDIVKLTPADRVVPGDQVIYTLQIRNNGAAAVRTPNVPYPIPDHMRYVADSAVGPGADVTYSIDGGRTFDRPENLKVSEPGGQMRTATAAEYTHIRWHLKNNLKSNSVAFARFRAVVK
jgi:uncharacterized repeat protein (TIGR01451 family)